VKANDLMAIDAHGHYGSYLRDNGDPLAERFMTASAGFFRFLSGTDARNLV